MKGQASLRDVDERDARLSAAGEQLERLNTVVAWEMFRKALPRDRTAQGGRRCGDDDQYPGVTGTLRAVG